MGISTVPVIVCPKLSLRIICTFTLSIIGIKLREASPKATVSNGEVAISFPYACAKLFISSRALNSVECGGNPMDLFRIVVQYSSRSLHSR